MHKGNQNRRGFGVLCFLSWLFLWKNRSLLKITACHVLLLNPVSILRQAHLAGKKDARSPRHISHLGVLENFVLQLSTFTSQSPWVQGAVESGGGCFSWNSLSLFISLFFYWQEAYDIFRHGGPFYWANPPAVLWKLEKIIYVQVDERGWHRQVGGQCSSLSPFSACVQG